MEETMAFDLQIWKNKVKEQLKGGAVG